MSVSESAASFLNLELIILLCDVAKVYKIPVVIDDSLGEVVSARTQLLDSKGFLIGSQITERLLVRESTWSSTPSDVARFVGNNFWTAVFGKKVDSVKVTSNVFHLREKNFRWLQGFSKKSEGSEQISVNDAPFAGDDHSVTRNDVVDFVVGMLKGATFLLYDESTVSVKGSCTADGETHFILTF
ncbi:hypothetical protein AGDE_07604 [Angomonas deanei]|uniref:Transport protein particle (TRAPP) component, putative n=1 Tax=Angomonas deanei TaxID=59799 RepID=A0A7G2CKD8_9TRYP|nr:hypothetical protein AGDE_07604 [Angomonas deanei]CAD2219855.1 Transport protein particle (TRAPP) component, putative [Angomonas deanei]|eukprot:EPY35067.1 hypothetical protein AGDE_07604 [Angomonas deanei]